MQQLTAAKWRYGSNAAERVKPDGAVCPLLIRERPHFCSAVIDVEGQKPPHAPQQIRRDYAARSTRISISLRSVPKSIGLVSSASAPLSKALRFVSTSP